MYQELYSRRSERDVRRCRWQCTTTTDQASKFGALSDGFLEVTNAASAADGDTHAQLAHDTADDTLGVTLTPASVDSLISHYEALSSNHVYTVKDTLANLSANTDNITTLLGNAASIEIVDSPGDDGSAIELDGNDSDVRDKLRTIVSRAVDTDDGNAAVPITVTLTGNYAKMLGDDAEDADEVANPITLTAVRMTRSL